MKTLTKAMVLSMGLIGPAQAGMFLELSVATPINDFTSTSCAPNGSFDVTQNPDSSYHIEYGCETGKYLGDTGHLGMVRIGYETKPYNTGPVGISANVFYLHMSDWLVSDGGLDVIAAGIRIQAKEK